jgi:hypothetical protein
LDVDNIGLELGRFWQIYDSEKKRISLKGRVLVELESGMIRPIERESELQVQKNEIED